jgi:hypothetical protein
LFSGVAQVKQLRAVKKPASPFGGKLEINYREARYILNPSNKQLQSRDGNHKE